MSERLQKILSAHGATSRREAERLIAAGRVAVNGVTALLGQSADNERDEITIDGIRIGGQATKVYIMLNKPRGYVTTTSDEKGRKTVTQLAADTGVRLYPVGRLDMDSEGLLIMTNDGEFANRVMHPSFNKKKTYRVTVRGDAEGALERLRCPMDIDGREIHAVSVQLTGRTDFGGVIEITIREGRNRQIRKMCALCGLHVDSLLRVSIGGLELCGLKTGQWRYLTDIEVKTLMGEGQ